jgi:hypothetical protein
MHWAKCDGPFLLHYKFLATPRWATVSLFPASGVVCIRQIRGNTPSAYPSWFIITQSNATAPPAIGLVNVPWAPQQTIDTLMTLNLGNWRCYVVNPSGRACLITHGWSAGQIAPTYITMTLQRIHMRIPQITRPLRDNIVSRSLSRRRTLCLALLMSSHPRLGENSTIPPLPKELYAELLQTWTHPSNPPRHARSMPHGRYTQEVLYGFTPNPTAPINLPQQPLP